MPMPSVNTERIEIIARGLGDLLPETVFVGGAVVEFYVTDPSAPTMRNTEDVDCVIPAKGPSEMRRWEAALRERGFRNDIRQGAPICRWLFENIPIDLMPPNELVFGFSNPWYASGIENTVQRELPSGRQIRIFALPWFVATKMAAVRSRGWSDLRWSHDFEDIVFLWDCIPDFAELFQEIPGDLADWIRCETAQWRKKPELREAIEVAIGSDAPKRIQRVIEGIGTFAAMGEGLGHPKQG